MYDSFKVNALSLLPLKLPANALPKNEAIMPSHIDIPSSSYSGIPTPSLSATFPPMGFAGQLKTLEKRQQELVDIVGTMKQESEEKDAKIAYLASRVEALERVNETLDSRRREAVSQLLNLRTRHQEAASAFIMRTNDIQPEDLEGMLVAWGTTINTVM